MGITKSGNIALSALRHTGPKGLAQANAHILKSLEDCGGDVKRTAAFLNIGRTTLIRWIKETPGLQEQVDALIAKTNVLRSTAVVKKK